VKHHEDPLIAGILRSYLGVLGFGIHILSGFIALGLAVNFVCSLIKRDFSSWWFWPVEIIAVLVLMIIAGNLLRLADKKRLKEREAAKGYG